MIMIGTDPQSVRQRRIGAILRYRILGAGNPADNSPMALPWLRILDAVIGVTDLARSRRIRQLATGDEPAAGDQSRLPAPFQARLAGFAAGALREVFDRDSRRLAMEAEQFELERQRAERLLQLELLRQSADREIGRLRALAAVDVVTWLASLIVAMRGGDIASRVAMGVGWVCLFAAIAASFTAQAAVSEAVARERHSTSDAGVLALWMTIAGLVLVALGALL
jgi:hypothetical protein